jgi:hypothetical protein
MTSVALQLVLTTKLYDAGIIPARLRQVRHCLVGLIRIERKVTETALISIRIQKYTKASTELNPGEKDSLRISPASFAEKSVCFWIIRGRTRSEKSKM